MDSKGFSSEFRVDKKKVSLKDFDPEFSPKGLTKESAQERLQAGIERLSEIQQRLYADNSYSLLCIFQAMDAAGKDGAIKHVFSGLNPQGCQVFSFKVPSDEELDHDFLWRYSKCLPERGRVGIFNRSYYEEVLVVRVHSALLDRQRLPAGPKGKEFWEKRFEDINNYERHLVDNGTIILKFFLNLSQDEQKSRFLERIENPKKNWKFSMADVTERGHWDDYQKAYEAMLGATSTDAAPWYVIPADKKWFSRVAVGEIIAARLEALDLKYPKLAADQAKQLKQAKAALESE